MGGAENPDREFCASESIFLPFSGSLTPPQPAIHCVTYGYYVPKYEVSGDCSETNELMVGETGFEPATPWSQTQETHTNYTA